MDVVVGEETGPSPLQHEAIVGSSNTVSAPSPQAFNNRSYAFYSWSDGQPQTHTLTAPATRHDLHRLICADHAGHPDTYVQPRRGRLRRGGKSEHQLRHSHLPAHRCGRQPRHRQLPALPADGHPGQDHERQAAPVRDQQHGRRAGGDADLELVDGERHHLGQQAGGDRRRGVRRAGRSRPGPGWSGTSPRSSPAPGRSTSCCTRPSATA